MYTRLEGQIADITSVRDALATQIIRLLESVEFGSGSALTHTSTSSTQNQDLTNQASMLLTRVSKLASMR